MVQGETVVNEAGRVRQGVSETGSDGESKEAGMRQGGEGEAMTE